MSRLMVCALLVVPLSAVAARGQDEQELSDLRRLIQSLESKLANLESSKDEDSRVTQIGGSTRVRDPDKMIVRIYDLSDLFSVAPAYTAQRESDLSHGSTGPVFSSAHARGVPANPFSMGGGLGGAGGYGGGAGGMGGMGGYGSVPSSPGHGGGGFFSIPSERPQTIGGTPGVLKQITQGGLADVRTTMDDLIDAITSTIAPTDWEAVGGPGSISQLGSALLVSAAENTHEQIDALLNLFRKRWGSLRTVSVQAWWMWMSDAEMAQLLPGDGKGDTGGIPAFGVVEDRAWAELLKQRRDRKDDDNSTTDFRAKITCYNGQTVHTVAGGQTLMVTSFIPVVGGGLKSAGSTGYRPVVSMIQEGAALQVTPVANRSGRFVVLDIHSRVNLFPPTDPPSDEATPDDTDGGEISQLAAAIDRPRLVNQRLSTTLRVPVDRTMLVGGMTFENPATSAPADLYLFVKVAVQELRDDLPDRGFSPTDEDADD